MNGFVFLFLFSASALAEYRAFRLHIINQKSGLVRQTLSTLDPEQYRTIFPLTPDESISYVETWRCLGRTDRFSPLCEKPDKNPARQPSQSPEKK